MLFVIRPRGGGKTTDAVRLARINPGSHIVTISTQEQARITREFPDLRGRVHTLRQIREGRFAGHREAARSTLIIDNLDLMMAELLGLPYLPEDVIATATGAAL